LNAEKSVTAGMESFQGRTKGMCAGALNPVAANSAAKSIVNGTREQAAKAGERREDECANPRELLLQTRCTAQQNL
jgi:hypothetical protein